MKINVSWLIVDLTLNFFIVRWLQLTTLICNSSFSFSVKFAASPISTTSYESKPQAMRLLRTSTLELQEFKGDQVPPYAILSHTWGTEEVTFQDFTAGSGKNLQGYIKIEQCCAQATLDGFGFVWIDTCCIDSASSADLTEAVNSMFRWYRNAQVCYVYLPDVSAAGTKPDTDAQISNSRWFTRGWTLPELLAPPSVEFFDKNWQKIGNKSEISELITLVTGITHLFNYQEASVAQKFSWVSKRQTTRVEDQAYCLMGLFDVNMAPRYGEGTKAFLRLQLKIIRNSDDESIFAWSTEGKRQQMNPYPTYGLLAPSPAAFASSGSIRRAIFDRNRGPYNMTNKGLSMEFLLIRGVGKYVLGPLNCRGGTDDSFVAVPLIQTPGGGYARPNYLSTVEISEIEKQRPFSEKMTIYVEQPRQNPTNWLDIETSRIEAKEYSDVISRLQPSSSSTTALDLPKRSPKNSAVVLQPIPANAYPLPARRLTWHALGKSLKHKRPRGCLLIITFFATFVAVSLFFGIFFTTRKEYGYSLGDAFTLASYVVAIGAFISTAMVAYHYPHCKCWGKAEGNNESGTELQQFRHIH